MSWPFSLLVHGDDINIVSQVLIGNLFFSSRFAIFTNHILFTALMVASTRFQRLFKSGGGYTLFIPCLVKLYVEAPSHPGILSAIEYAASRQNLSLLFCTICHPFYTHTCVRLNLFCYLVFFTPNWNNLCNLLF